MKIRISKTIANEYLDRWPDRIPGELGERSGVHEVCRTDANNILADAQFMADKVHGPEEMRPAVRQAYRALANQVAKLLGDK